MSGRDQGPRRRRGRRVLVGAASVAGHLLAFIGFLSIHPHAVMRPAPEPAATIVALVELPRPPERPRPATAPRPQAPAAKSRPTPVKPPPSEVRRSAPALAPVKVAPSLEGKGPPSDAAGDVSDGDLASAGTAGSGGAGGGCDMIGRLQSALRRDRLVQAAVARAPRGKAILVWNGAWVRRPDQDGAGLAAVRESLMWEIAFAPQACRSQPMRGLVLITLAEGPDGARLVLGAGSWRWTDLLGARRGGARG